MLNKQVVAIYIPFLILSSSVILSRSFVVMLKKYATVNVYIHMQT